MAKTDNKCWSCGQDTTISLEELGHGWQKCSNCGATNMPNPTRLRQETVVVDGETSDTYNTEYRPRKRRLP